ncbi:MED14-domain-containing protein [Parathielavia appendiculata]|uniref:Mediator of RNA polymerase II transcription subunit 14 n=1 Tax=Parathielavia appendiculata TaxID=2587402 RepID=A0AAN6Z9G1_9PEZI|nr:MED14-domain-containing protein [Parathielavia appendiculata]
MDNGIHNRLHSDKAQASLVNGVKEEPVSTQRTHSPDNKGADNGAAVVRDYSNPGSNLHTLQNTEMEELPDELQHITADSLPLSLLLSRLAQFSHAKLQELILNLASKPLPESFSNGNSGVNGAVKGSANAGGHVPEDTSPESLDKKTMVLNFIQDLHSRWVKALVITEWAKNADEVGKLIDLRTHLADKLELYNKTFWELVRVKQELAFAKVPSPDLKTALEVLTSGSVHWMPDFGYLLKPPLTTQEKLHWLNEIEVTLHMRLQLHEYERIPQPWRQYKVENGRVTFTVPGEFEVDLTISDEDFDSQFWFLDYRPIFTPAPAEVSEHARAFIEAQVNTVLQTEGLPGCYKYLHELTLTAKIGEFYRQAVELTRTGLWVQTLKVERLDRAMSIQYWAQSPLSRGTPSWILLGVHSGKAPEGLHDPGTPSHIMLQWFREGKEAKDISIPFDVDTISTEKVLTTVISRHVEYLLGSMYNALLGKPRFTQRQGTIALRIADQPDTSSALTMQLLGKHDATLGVGTWMGNFYFHEQTPTGRDWAQRFNSLRNPAHEGANLLEQIRWSYTARRLRMLPKPAIWVVLPQAPVPSDEVKSVVYSPSSSTREPFHAIWVRNTRWRPQWFAMMSLSLGGDGWWLVEVSAEGRGFSGPRITTFTQLPMTPSDPRFPENSWFPELTKHTTSIMAHIDDLRGLHQQRTRYGFGKSRDSRDLTTYVRSPDMLASQSAPDDISPSPWATQFIPLVYKGPAPILGHEFADLIADAGSLQKQPARQRVLVEAKVAVTNRARFVLLERKLDRDVFYDHELGQFTLRFRPDAGSGAVPLLRARMLALNRLVGIVDGLARAGKRVMPERVTLREIVFTYGDGTHGSLPPDQLSAPSQEKQQTWRLRLNLAKDQGVDVILEEGNPHLRVKDYLQAFANSPKLRTIPGWLFLTLPLFRALERLESSWDSVLAKEQGACYTFHKSMDWVTIRFALSGAKGRRMHLDIKPRDREGNLVWHVYRPMTDANATNENDEFNKVLKERVWSVDGQGFKGLMNGALASWDGGIENLIALIGETIQSLAGTPPPSLAAAQPHQLSQALSAAQQQQQQPAEHHQPVAPPGGGPQPARFASQQAYQQQQQQTPCLPQASMHPQGQPQVQQQQQQQRTGIAKNNTPVVVID